MFLLFVFGELYVWIENILKSGLYIVKVWVICVVLF